MTDEQFHVFTLDFLDRSRQSFKVQLCLHQHWARRESSSNSHHFEQPEPPPSNGHPGKSCQPQCSASKGERWCKRCLNHFNIFNSSTVSSSVPNNLPWWQRFQIKRKRLRARRVSKKSCHVVSCSVCMHACVCGQQALLCFTDSISYLARQTCSGMGDLLQESCQHGAKRRRGSATCLTRSSHPLSPGSTRRGGSKGGLCGTHLFCHRPASTLWHFVCVCVTKHFMIVYDILRYDMLWLLIMIYYDILWYVMKLYSSSYCYILLLCDIVRVHRLCVMLFLYTGVLHSPTPFLQIPKNSKACVPTVSSF